MVTRSDHRGPHADTPSLLTACGTPDDSGVTVATTLVCFHFLHTGLRVQRAPGVPRALSMEGDDVNHTSDVETRREIAKPYLDQYRCLACESELRLRH